MALFYDPVIFEIKAKATEAIATFKEVNLELAKMEKNGMLAGGSLGTLTKTARLAKTAFLGVAGAFGVLSVASLETLDRVEKSQANLSTAIQNTGVSFKVAKPFVDTQVESMKNLGFGITDVYDALTKMTAASGSPKIALESLGVAADLARFKNIDLAEAGRLLARASVGQARGLADLGIAIGKTIPKNADLATILKAVEDRAGGAAKAFRDTLPGSIAYTRAAFTELELKLGEKLLPKAIEFVDWLNKSGIPSIEKFGGFVSRNSTVIEQLGMALGGLWLGGKIAAGIEVVATAVTGLAGAMTALGASFGVVELGFAAIAPEIAVIAGIVGAVGFGAYKLYNMMHKSKTPSLLPKTSASQFYKPGMDALKGSPVTRITPTTSGGVTVNQNITVYAHNANDLSTQLIQKAKNGSTLGIKALDTVASIGGSKTSGYGGGGGIRGRVMI